IRLDIIDDGEGFDPTGLEASSEQSSASSYGLRFMRERARELGGGLDLGYSPGQGTALSAYLPVNPGMDTRPVTQENTLASPYCSLTTTRWSAPDYVPCWIPEVKCPLWHKQPAGKKH